jgi:hypothetical protein
MSAIVTRENCNTRKIKEKYMIGLAQRAELVAYKRSANGTAIGANRLPIARKRIDGVGVGIGLGSRDLVSV